PPRCWRHGRPAAGISYFLAARARTSWLRGLVLPGCAGTYFLAARARTSWPRGHGWVATRLLCRCRSTWRAVAVGLAWGVEAWCAPGGWPGLWFLGRRR